MARRDRKFEITVNGQFGKGTTTMAITLAHILKDLGFQVDVDAPEVPPAHIAKAPGIETITKFAARSKVTVKTPGSSRSGPK